jgi:hypothetical protein
VSPGNQHNRLSSILVVLKERASFATKSRGSWKLVYYEAYLEREDAEGRENFLKSGAGRRFLRVQLRHYLKRFPARPGSRRMGEGFGAVHQSAT